MRDAWLEYLGFFETVLDGELILPHWRFDHGINLKRLPENPHPWSPVLILYSTSVTPYLEGGKIAVASALEPAALILVADLFAYAIWFN